MYHFFISSFPRLLHLLNLYSIMKEAESGPLTAAAWSSHLTFLKKSNFSGSQFPYLQNGSLMLIRWNNLGCLKLLIFSVISHHTMEELKCGDEYQVALLSVRYMYRVVMSSPFLQE